MIHSEWLLLLAAAMFNVLLQLFSKLLPLVVYCFQLIQLFREIHCCFLIMKGLSNR